MTFSGGGLIETDSTVREIIARHPETPVVKHLSIPSHAYGERPTHNRASADGGTAIPIPYCPPLHAVLRLTDVAAMRGTNPK